MKSKIAYSVVAGVFSAILAGPTCCADHDSSSGKPYHIYATAWGASLAADGTGFYNDMARLVLGPLMAEVQYDLIPYRRANRIFDQDKASCHYPSTLHYMSVTGIVADTSSLIQTRNLIRTVARVFSRRGETPPSSVEDARGKSIAYTMGAEIPVLFEGYGRRFIPVADETHKAEMLLSGRVDLMVGYTPDILLVYQQLGEQIPAFDPSFSINDEHNAFVCHRTPANEGLVAKIDARVESLLESGAFADFLEGYGLTADEYLVR